VARGCCFGVAGAFALKRSRVEAICGLRREHRDRSVARNRGLRRVELFELGGREVAERLVQPLVVEPADVLDDRELEVRFGVRRTRSASSSVLKESTKLSASALS
jgi:hypothetical protein